MKCGNGLTDKHRENIYFFIHRIDVLRFFFVIIYN
jgi:hypothetical protein